MTDTFRADKQSGYSLSLRCFLLLYSVFFICGFQIVRFAALSPWFTHMCGACVSGKGRNVLSTYYETRHPFSIALMNQVDVKWHRTRLLFSQRLILLSEARQRGLEQHLFISLRKHGECSGLYRSLFLPPSNRSLRSQGNEAVSYVESDRAALVLAC